MGSVRRKISIKTIALASVIVAIFAIPITIYAVNQSSKELVPEQKYFPVDNASEYVEDVLLVKFARGYQPDLVYSLVAEREELEKSTLGKTVILRQNSEFVLSGQKTPEERKVVLDQLFGDLGVVSYMQTIVTDDPNLSRYYTLNLPPGSDLNDAQMKLGQSEATINIEPDYVDTIFQSVTPNDPSYQSMWGLNLIEVEEGWKNTTGSKSVLVGVADTGVDLSHIDLRDNIFSNGKNMLTNSDNAQDDHYHGTHVAGTIGAVGNNSIGVAGVNWNTSLLPVKVCNSQGSCPASAVAAGISYAAGQGARVVNVSIGGTPGCSQRPLYQDAVNYALGQGTLVVVAAGNSDVNASGIAPASCSGVLTVGAVGPNGSRASYSNFGTNVEISAPGGTGSTGSTGILSTYSGNQYSAISGTSMAAPHVAGVAALILSVMPDLTPLELKACLIAGATPITTDKQIGPLLNVPGAFASCGVPQDISPEPSTAPTVTVAPSAPPGASGNSVGGIAYHDRNNNFVRDAGEEPVAGVLLTLTDQSSLVLNATTPTNGEFLFPNLSTGNYTLSQSYNGTPMWAFNQFDITDTEPTYYFNIPISGVVDVPTPSPTDVIIFPTVPTTTTAPTPSVITPTPTPLVFYNCKPIQTSRNENGRQVKLSYLDCTKVE